MNRIRHGFSLIETMLALGIMATLLTAMLGLLPAGLEATHKASQRAVERRILERLHLLSVQGDLEDEFHFDREGILVSANNEDRAWVAKIKAGVPAVLPGAEAPALRTWQVELCDQAILSKHTLVLSQAMP
jgi:uncharacterized protein (TIGR02598 family)